MANADRPRGAEPFGSILRATAYKAKAAIYRGDPVALTATGDIQRSAGDALIGFAIDTQLTIGEDVLVADHPDQRYIIQADETEISALTEVGGNFDIVLGSADTTFEKSQSELDSSTADAHSAVDNPLKLLDIDRRNDNAFGAQVDCVVKINNHQLAGGTGSAAV